MQVMVPRTVCLIKPNQYLDRIDVDLSLRDFRKYHGYVLVGESGIGKSTEFKRESKQESTLAPISARYLLECNLQDLPQWQNGPIFIDGLDEVRVHSGDSRSVINSIIKRLKILGTPQFRISIRSDSWFGVNEIKVLESVCSESRIPILRLNPLMMDDIHHIVSEQQQDSDCFIREACKHGMVHLLFNPLLLQLLLAMRAKSSWPKTLSEVLEKICDPHLEQYFSEFTKDARVHGVGQLSALMLLRNKIGLRLSDEKPTDIFSSENINTSNSDTLHSVITSGFVQGDSTCRIPIHRILFEFAGARYLASKIHDDVSAQRILTLFTGSNGLIYPDLQGLVAWLACLAPKVRSYVIKSDPTTLIYNGDISNFSGQDTKQLIGKLHKNALSFNLYPTPISFGAFADQHAESCLTEFARSSNRTLARQILIDVLLRSISYKNSQLTNKNTYLCPTESDPNVGVLLSMIRDSSWRSIVRCNAIAVLSAIFPQKSQLKKTLKTLLNEVNNHDLKDDDGHLRNILLDCLYPSVLKPSEIWHYLPTVPINQKAAYHKFFLQLVVKSEKDDIIELLNSLCVHTSEIIPKLDQHHLTHMVVVLLSRGLELHGTKRDIPEIFAWFDLVEANVTHPLMIPKNASANSLSMAGNEANVKIRNWLNEHPKTQFDLIKHGLLIHESKIGKSPLHVMVGLKFVGHHPKKEFRERCLSYAVSLVDSHSKIAEELARWATDSIDGWGTPLSDDLVLQMISETEKLQNWNHKRLERKKQISQEDEQRRVSENLNDSIVNSDRNHEIVYLREHITELSEGRCALNLLDKLARLYFQGHKANLENSMSPLEYYLGGDQTLIKASLSGFRQLLKRDDLPDLADISNDHEKGHQSLYALAFLVGMQEGGKNSFAKLSETGKRRALGFLFVIGHSGLKKFSSISNSLQIGFSWYTEALSHYPDIVADVMVSIHRACVRSKKLPPSPYLLQMAHDKSYSMVASKAVFQMFTIFPTRCNGLQLKSLSPVLWSALSHSLSQQELQTIVLHRISRKNMDAGQRAQWLCTGLAVAREHCLGLLVGFLSERGESRIHYVMDFLRTGEPKMIFKDIQDWTSKDLSLLIQALGPWVNPDRISDHDQEEKSQQLEVYLMKCLNQIGDRTDLYAINALNELALRSELGQWRDAILRARQKQTWWHRVEHSEDLTLAQIQTTIDGGDLSRNADLNVVTVQILRELTRHRPGNGVNNHVHQFWHMDFTKGVPIKPKPEDHCRDVLRSHLQKKLQKYRVDVQPKGIYTDDRRSHIHICYENEFLIPIEIIGNHHHKIWRSINENLVSNYLYNQFSDGYGIYLVLWFGSEYMRVPLPSGRIPQKPEELQKLLQEQIPQEAERHISVIVIDVSPMGSPDLVIEMQSTHES